MGNTAREIVIKSESSRNFFHYFLFGLQKDEAMPITYNVYTDGHFIHAIAKGPLSTQEFIDYEVAHAIDKRIKPPVSELFEITSGAVKHITMDDMKAVIKCRAEVKRLPTPHRCAIALGSMDAHSWNLAKFYEGMVMLHSPETVIIFAHADLAKQWIGFSHI